MNEADRTMPNRAENEFFVDLVVVNNDWYKHRDAVLPRLRRVSKDAERDLDRWHELTERLMEWMCETIPTRKLVRYQQLAKSGKHYIDFPDPSQIRGMHRLVSTYELAVVAEHAMRGECAMCVRDGAEVKHCPLREALYTIAPPEKASAISCEYRDAAGALVTGREIKL